MEDECKGCSYWRGKKYEYFNYCHYMIINGVSRARDENGKCMCYTTKHVAKDLNKLEYAWYRKELYEKSSRSK